MNIAHFVERGAHHFPDRPALHFEGQSWSYDQLHTEIKRAANGFADLGIGRGDRVAIWLPNTAVFIIAYFAIHKLGAVAVTINTALKAEEMQFILADSGAKLLITAAALYATLSSSELAKIEHVVLIEGEAAGTIPFATLLEEAATTDCDVEMAADDPALLLYTSGTTGFPKGALLSHQAVIIAAELAITTFDLRPEDRVLLPLSIFHSFGQTAGLLPTLAAGATLILHRQFEPKSVLASVEDDAATIFFGVPTTYILLQAQATRDQLRSVRRYISAGAPLPLEVGRRWQATYSLPINEGYGLTEICLGTFNHDPQTKPGSVGTPLAGIRLNIVDEDGLVLPPGEVGEVVIETPSAMVGYWQRPQESDAVLRSGRFHTGDIGRVDADGYVYIVDRIKDMVNVGGVKVYPSEVEQILYEHPAVNEVAVYGIPEAVLGEQVQASVVLKKDTAVHPQELIAFCRQRLADFKVPSTVYLLDQLPKNRTGKILKRILREQGASLQVVGDSAQSAPRHSPLASPHQAQATTISQWMADWLANQLGVEVAQISWDTPFAELGMASVMAVNFARALGDWLGHPIDPILLWNFPTIRDVVGYLITLSPDRQINRAASAYDYDRQSEPIALIGIGCRFPGGADTPGKFWKLLHDGIDPVREIPTSRWSVDEYYDANPNVAGKMYVRAASLLDNVDQFDAQFFGISPLEAAALDPQQRLLLEVTWQALEDANLAADQIRESCTGVYVGAFWDDYSAANLYNTAEDEIDSYRILSNLRGMMAGRLAYVLGLHGPAMQLDTACSSSLLAVHLACQSLRTGECDLALAGGVNLILSPQQLIGLCHMGAVSPDGRCKSFAADADGFGIGEGVGVVVLKRLTDAVNDGDRILAVIRGSAANHDGASNGLTAPNGRAQEAMLRQALNNAAVQPQQIQYVETHGTGTVLGDPIEIHALINVLGQKRNDPLLIGSVKSNIGHLSAAAGVAALIKVALALKEGEIPPNLHFTNPNPHIPWATAPLRVPTAPTAWPSTERRRAGISSFGLTGTNVHLVVEEAPPQAKRERTEKEVLTGSALPASNGTHRESVVPLTTALERPVHLLTLSAKSEQALTAQINQMETWVAAQPANPNLLADLCHTAATSRVHWNHRLSIIAPDLSTLRARLHQAKFETNAPGIIHNQKDDARSNSRIAPKVAFLFAGQGPQYANMGRQLYATQPLFRRTLDQCDEILRDHLDRSLLEILYGADQMHADVLLNEATYAQPALFAIEYALATLWRSWGVEPTVVIGHSLGEYAAACVAGVFSLEDGLKLVATRGRLMQIKAPKGQMVAVLGTETEVRQILAPYAQAVSLAAINTPQSLVIAGDPEIIQFASHDLQHEGIEIRPLKIYVASHSPLMEPILDEFSTVAHTVNFQRPRLPVISNVTGALADEALASPDYWRRHLREPVQFAQGMTCLADLGIDTFVETGPKTTLLGLGRQCLQESDARLWLPSIHPKTEEWNQLLESLAELYGRGAAINWRGFDQEYQRTKVALPSYPFQRQRYWIDEERRRDENAKGRRGREQNTQHTTHSKQHGHPLLGRQIQSVLAARHQEVIFEARIDLAALPYLADHTLFEQVIIPGAAYFETILAAAAHLWPQRHSVLTDCAIQQGMFLPSIDHTGDEVVGATVQIVFTPADGGYQWQIYSLSDGDQTVDGWTLHASGRMAPAQVSLHVPVDLAALRARCHTTIDRIYAEQQFRDQGINYGPDFQALAQLFVGNGEALGHVVLPPTLTATAGDYQLHPVLLDAALCVASSLLPEGESDPYLPFGMERMQLYKSGIHTRLWSHVQQRATFPDSQQVDITLIDEEGDVVAQFTNFTLRRAGRQSIVGHQRRLDWLYELAWNLVPRARKSPFAQEAGRWIILADRKGLGADLAARLEAQGEPCLLLYQAALTEAGGDVAFFMRLLQAYRHLNPTPVRGVVYLWGLDTEDSTDEDTPNAAFETSSQFLHLVQALLAEDLSPRLWIVTRQAVGMGKDSVQLPQSPLWGIGRTLHWEQPELACTCVDLREDVGAPALFEEIWYADDENQIILRRDERLAARLVRHCERTTQPLVLNAQRSYLVTGGLGGLGLEVAQWLVAKGARYLVLAGRRGAATAVAQVAIRAMEDAGAQIVLAQADIAEQGDVVGLLATCQAIAPLGGIIHAAGIIDDGLLLQQTATRFAQVMAPKVAGSWHLHTLTRDLPLDFFVCFSSVSSLLGNSGQCSYAAANAFMDALTYQRLAEGRAALSINWGGWSDVGLAAELVKTTEAAGLGAIAPSQGLDLLGVLLTHQTAQVGVLPIQWRRFQQGLSHRAGLPVLHQLLEQTTPQKGAASLRQQLSAVPTAERYGLVKAHVQDLMLKLLGRTPADDESFLLFGLDSLMSIQMANRLATALEISLPATLAFKYETVEQLTSYLLERMGEASMAGATASLIVEPSQTPLADWYPQLYNQRECYVWHETVENKACLHVQHCAYIHSPVDRQRLAAALQALVDRHEALRTVYTRRGEDLLQRTLATQSVDFAAVDVADLPWSALVEPILTAAREPFNLDEGPVLRGRLYSRAEDEHLFLLVVHHIAADATALSVIINELWTLYEAIASGTENALPPISATWTDFVRWQTDLLQSDEGERLWHYWQNQMAGDLPRLNLPTDFPRPPKDSHHGRPAYFEIDAALIHQLRQLAQREGCTLYMVLMAGFQSLLHHYTQQRDLVVMAHVANRNDLAFADMVGYLADTFPIRTQIAEDATFHDVLRQVQPTILGAMEHQGFPLRLLAERLHIEEDPTRPILSPVWFTLLPLRLFEESGALLQTGSGPIDLGGLTLEATDLLPAWLGVWYDLEMILTEGEEVVFGTLVYKTDLFTEPTIQRMIADFQTLLQRMAEDASQSVHKQQLDQPNGHSLLNNSRSPSVEV